MRFSPILPAVLILSTFACKKPRSEDVSVFHETSSAIFYTSLADALPSKSYEALNPGKVVGIKYKNLNGKEVRYFSYESDKKKLLRIISQMAFPTNMLVSDTLCRKISIEELQSYGIPDDERTAGRDFWSAHDNVEAYECIKGNMKHTLLTSKTSRQIFHRIEYLNS